MSKYPSKGNGHRNFSFSPVCFLEHSPIPVKLREGNAIAHGEYAVEGPSESSSTSQQPGDG